MTFADPPGDFCAVSLLVVTEPCAMNRRCYRGACDHLPGEYLHDSLDLKVREPEI